VARVTPYALLNLIVNVCTQSPIVAAYAVRTVDLDVLSLRVHLIDDSFIEVFYNDATSKTAFALIVNQQRIYGKDNAKIGWHVHPLASPLDHVPCNPVTFEEFLAEVELLHFSSSARKEDASTLGRK